MLFVPAHSKSYEAANIIQSHPSPASLCLESINFQFRKICFRRVQSLEELQLLDSQDPRFRRKKELDQIDVKTLTYNFKNIRRLVLRFQMTSDRTLKLLLPSFQKLQQLQLARLNSFTNQGLQIVVTSCNQLTSLKLSGKSDQFNQLIDKEGLGAFYKARFRLRTIQLKFIEKIGDQQISELVNFFKSDLEEFSVIRNCYDKCFQITDKAIQTICACEKLLKLNITYSRNFKEKLATHVARLTGLQELILADCLFQYSMLPINSLSNLKELNLSGDCWIRDENLQVIGRHPSLQIFHMGHVEHSDMNCSTVVDRTALIATLIAIFTGRGLFLRLRRLLLEENCLVTYKIDFKIGNLRPDIEIRYTKGDELLSLLRQR